MSTETEFSTDVLVIGSGIAGCFAAIKAREQGAEVILLDKGYVGKSGQSPWAQHQVYFDPAYYSEFDGYMNRVNEASEYVNDREWTEITLKESYDRFQDRISYGVEFLKLENGEWAPWPPKPLEKLANSPVRNVIYFAVDHMKSMRKHAQKIGVKVMDRVMIYDLLKQDGRIAGAMGMPVGSYDVYVFKAKATVLAAGTSSLKPYAGVPTGALTGDAEAMAYNAGAEITGKEWVFGRQVSAEFPDGVDYHLKEDFRTYYRLDEINKKTKIYNAEGEALASGSDYMIANEVNAGKAPLFWDVETQFDARKATGYFNPQGHRRNPVDVEAEKANKFRILIGGALGMSAAGSSGIWPVDTKCATQLPGLYVGGTACGARQGIAGAGFPTMCCCATGARAGIGAAEYAMQMSNVPEVDKGEIERLKKIAYAPTERKGGFTPGWTKQVLRNIGMPYWILYYKHGERLQSALTQVEFMRDRIIPKLTARDPHELRLARELKNMTLTFEMILRASIYRTESRLTHYREDCPRREDPEWLAWVKIREEDGEMKLYKEPIPEKWWPDMTKSYEERYPRDDFEVKEKSRVKK